MNSAILFFRYYILNLRIGNIMKTALSLILFTTSSFFSSCQQDRKNITVFGKITDETTGRPIANAEVLVVCWYKFNIEVNSIKEQTITTDSNGNYKAHFDKGYQADVASKAKGYLPFRSYNKLNNNEIQVNLKLSRAKNNPTLVIVLNTDYIRLEGTEKSPFLRIRIHAAKGQNTLDLNNIETFGLDCINLTTKTDTTQCDLWFKTEKKEGQPNTIITNKMGGIIPIYRNEIKSSILYEKYTAPITGYKREYSLNGQEAGFFILCRDGKTYSKIILEQTNVDERHPDSQGSFYIEFGKIFTCFYQPNGTTDLSYPQTDINLKNFLTDYSMLK